MLSSSSDRRVTLTLLGLTAAMTALFCFNPATTPWLPRCPIYEFTGLYCPGCGTTRMLHLLLHGHPLLALHQNALTLILLPAALCLLIRHAAGQGPNLKLTPRLCIVLALLIAAFTIARNLPFHPFTSLAPLPLAKVRIRSSSIMQVCNSTHCGDELRSR